MKLIKAGKGKLFSYSAYDCRSNGQKDTTITMDNISEKRQYFGASVANCNNLNYMTR